jgi:hypothetical protein
VEIVVRDRAFDGDASVRIVTGETDAAARTLPDVETAKLEEVTESTSGSTLVLDLPAKSFALVEAALTAA